MANREAGLIVGVSCSPRRDGTTLAALKVCLDAAREFAPELGTELIELAGMDVRGCLGCGGCREGLRCVQKDDFSRILIARLARPEVAGLIIGTPVYFGSMTSLCKAFLERTVVLRRNGFLLRNKAGGVVAVGGVRNGGQELSIQAVQAAMFCHDMIVVGDGRPGAHYGAALWSGGPEGAGGDETGKETARSLGRRVAEAVRLCTACGKREG